LDAKAKALSMEGKQIPSDNNFFLYVADPITGLIRIQQDAAFIVEAVLVVNPQIDSTGVGGKTPFFYELALKDANAGRDLTGGFHALYTAIPITEEDTDFVPGGLFVPITGSSDDIFIPNVDDWKTTKTEYILPRGAVVRPTFKSSGPHAVGPGTDVALPDVILAGYKVF
jgi:hypothetical protein